MREYKSIIVVATIAIAFVAWWATFPRTDGDVGALVNKGGISLFGDSLERKSRSLSGWRSKNCGRVSVTGGHAEVAECAMTAFRNNQPFRARYDIQGLDSVVSISIVRPKSGGLLLLSVDDESHGTRFSQDVRVRGCPEPAFLATTEMGRLTCYPKSETSYR